MKLPVSEVGQKTLNFLNLIPLAFCEQKKMKGIPDLRNEDFSTHRHVRVVFFFLDFVLSPHADMFVLSFLPRFCAFTFSVTHESLSDED